jgi:hypothetical protein
LFSIRKKIKKKLSYNFFEIKFHLMPHDRRHEHAVVHTGDTLAGLYVAQGEGGALAGGQRQHVPVLRSRLLSVREFLLAVVGHELAAHAGVAQQGRVTLQVFQ